MQITVAIPTYNERENLPVLVPILFGLPIPELKILVVDDASPDGTGEIADTLASEYPGRLDVIHRQNKSGLGTAYLEAFNFAIHQGADAIAQMDADFSHPPEKLVEMIGMLDHYDCIIGSRYITGGSLDEQWPVWRKTLSAFGNAYVRTILGLPLRDITGGFRVFRKDALNKIPLHRVRSNGYAFQIEMAYLSILVGNSHYETPIHFQDRRWGQSKMSIKIQVEAAFKVWQILIQYQDLRLKVSKH